MPSRWAKRQPRQSRARYTFEVIVEAAHQILAQGHEPSTNSIADRAGVGVASVYDYFGDKIAVMGEVGERLLRSNIDASERTYDWLSRRDEHPLQMFQHYLRDAARRRRAPVARRLLKAASDHGHREFIEAYLRRAEQIFQRAVQRHPELDGSPIGVALLTRAIAAGLEHAVDETGWLDEPETFERVVEELAIIIYSYTTADRAALLARLRGESEAAPQA